MPRQLIYQGCDGKDAAVVEWNPQNTEAPAAFKTDLTPIKVYLSPPDAQGGELNPYQYYEFFYRYKQKQYNSAAGGPNTYWVELDIEGNPLISSFYVYGAPSNLRLVLQGIDPNGISRNFWTITVDGISYDYIYNETTDQWEQIDVPYQEDIGFLESYSQPIYSGQTYGETEILEKWVIDENGNRKEFGGAIGGTTWKIAVESSIDGTYEQIFEQTFLSEPQNIRVDCDQCSNECLKIVSDDRKRFTCVCRD
ncbi:MAG: hypothetical protein KME13_13070 [Myxacorys californica WJT36-NPBG1]|jgi:hypothetical protein|nr:hypothetical protein [Myxacorys californica WJT36-NPBG1]